VSGDVALLAVLFFGAATLYSSVGHAGASGYLAAMALVGMAPAAMRPTALVLNILVASLATQRFARAGHFAWPVFLPLVVGSVPLAFVGGALVLPGRVYKVAVGVMLLLGAVQLWRTARRANGAGTDGATRRVPIAAAVACGAVIGLLAGLTGTGGGIFLSPILLALDWCDMRKTAGVSAAFILANSIAGLLGTGVHLEALPDATSLAVWALAVCAGGVLGSSLGSRRLGVHVLRRLLAVVLVAAATKLILT